MNSPTDRFMTVTVRTNPIDGHTAWWMQDTATLDKATGNVQIAGTIEDDNWFGGFTGGVHVVGLDDYGHTLAQTSINGSNGALIDPAWGVCGTWEPCQSSRSLFASLQMNGDVKDVTHLMIVNWHDGHNRLAEDLNLVDQVFKTTKDGIAAAAAVVAMFG